MTPDIKNDSTNYIGFRIVRKHPDSCMKIGLLYNNSEQNFQLNSEEEIAKRKEDDDWCGIGQKEINEGDIIFFNITRTLAVN